MEVTAAAVLFVGALAKGAPVAKRPIGQPEHQQPPKYDHDWPSRQGDGLDLTLNSVRITPGLEPDRDRRIHHNLETRVDVLVVGGAAAGLSAASTCQDKGLSCVVIEKNVRQQIRS